MDRHDASASEAFFVILEPGEAPPIHVHRDAEQVFFILEGEGKLGVGPGATEKHPLRVGDFVRTPPGAPHAVRCTGPPPEEPTWDGHVRVMCATNGWNFDAVKLGPIDSDDHVLRGG